MTRLALLLAASACAAAPHPVAPAPVVRYELPQFETAGCGNFCSIHIPLTTTRTWGTLELRGDTARLSLGSDSFTPHVVCPSAGPRDPFTPCIQADDPRVRDKPSHAEIDLTGTAARRGTALAIAVARGELHIELACTDRGSELDCAVTSEGAWGGVRLPDRVRLAQPTPAVRGPVATM